jgi:hypothetical protein
MGSAQFDSYHSFHLSMVNLICAIWLVYKMSDRSVRRIGDGRCLRGTRGIGNSITPPPEFGDQPVIRNTL